MKFSKERALKIINIVFIIILILILINALSRTEVELTEEQISTLEKIFPESHIEKIKIYKGGLLSIGTAKTLCNSIYFHKKEEIPTYLLVHETAHTYQFQTPSNCLKLSISSLYLQFTSFLESWDRTLIYDYSLNQKPLNVEQEASKIEDFYYLKYEQGDLSSTGCLDCEEYEYDKVITVLESETQRILEKYKIS